MKVEEFSRGKFITMSRSVGIILSMNTGLSDLSR